MAQRNEHQMGLFGGRTRQAVAEAGDFAGFAAGAAAAAWAAIFANASGWFTASSARLLRSSAMLGHAVLFE